jgi:hypothetical protein
METLLLDRLKEFGPALRVGEQRLDQRPELFAGEYPLTSLQEEGTSVRKTLGAASEARPLRVRDSVRTSLTTHRVLVDNGRQPCVEDLAQLRILRPAWRVLFNLLLLCIPESLAGLEIMSEVQ